MADSGASLYVLEAGSDWVEDLHPDVPQWIGPEALKKILRHALSRRAMHFIGHADFQPTDGYPAEATLFNPDAEAHRRAPESGMVGFRIRITARSRPAAPDGAPRIAVDWAAEQLSDVPGKTGMGIQRSTEPIETGSTELPPGAAILIRHPKAGRREYILLLRVVSLRQ